MRFDRSDETGEGRGVLFRLSRTRQAEREIYFRKFGLRSDEPGTAPVGRLWDAAPFPTVGVGKPALPLHFRQQFLVQIRRK